MGMVTHQSKTDFLDFKITNSVEVLLLGPIIIKGQPGILTIFAVPTLALTLLSLSLPAHPPVYKVLGPLLSKSMA